MAPIKLGFIGLSSSETSKWASQAHLPYLLSPHGRQKYQIVALLNSSEEAARAAIEKYGLAPSTRAYGKPEDLAADPDIELVVDVTRVDKHYPTILPSIKAGKNVFVEWPLADNLERVRELVALAHEKGIRTAVGIQGRLSPIFLKVRAVLVSGRIGKVLSSEARADILSDARDSIPLGRKYLTQRKIGGNAYTIGFGHLIDAIQSVLGDIQNERAHFQLENPLLKLKDPNTHKTVDTVKTDVPDLVILTGSLRESTVAEENATVNIRYHRGPPFKGEPAFVWTIRGQKGELRLVSPGGPGLWSNDFPEPVTIEVYDYATEDVSAVEWQWADWQLDISSPVKGRTGRNIASIYEAYAEGDESKYAVFGTALKRHEQLDKWIQEFGA